MTAHLSTDKLQDKILFFLQLHRRDEAVFLFLQAMIANKIS